MGLFQVDTQIERIADNRWRAQLSENWCVGPVPNGGYVMAIAAKAIADSIPHDEPLSINAFYMAPTHVGECDIAVELLRTGKSTTYAVAKLFQDNELKAQFTAAFTSLDLLRGETLITQMMPDIPVFDDCIEIPKVEFIKLQQHTVQRVVPNAEQNLIGKPLATGEWLGYTEFTDQENIDVFALLYFADAFPPPIFTHYGPSGWVPTVELTVQVRAKPKRGPLKVHFKTTMLTQGILEEDGVLWDSDNNLVAISRQTAKFRKI